MIERYTRPIMGQIWSEENKFAKWLEVELLACEALAEHGQIPRAAAEELRGRAVLNLPRMREIEAEVKHDVVAFVSSVAEPLGEAGRYLHLGLTSSDVIDTAFAVQLAEATDLLLADVEALLAILTRLARQHAQTLTIGRTHGVHAEPITFGLKAAHWYAEMQRGQTRLRQARQDIAHGKISGAVGTFANIDPEIEAFVCRRLGLQPEPISTQIVPRDRHAAFFSTLALIGSSLERIATELRHLQRTEVLEVEEPFSPGQKGSSAMPHKKNPVLTENLTGLARMVRAAAIPAMENVALWHERDISHSSVERMIGPDATITLDFALARLTGVIDKMLIFPENMMENMNKFPGLVMSQRVLLALTQAGVSREDAYAMVQRNALKVWEHRTDFKEELLADADVTAALSPEEIEEKFDLGYHTKHVDTIFARVFGE